MSAISAFPILLLPFLLCSSLLSIQGCPPHQLQTLLRLRSTLNDTNGFLNSWEGADCCTWYRVECHGTQGGRHVSKMDLQGISPTISNLGWLSNFSSLEYLSLSGVAVSDKRWGSIIGSLLHLKHLHMSFCSLPASTIPSALFNLSSLTFLDLSVNSFSNIPTWMGNLFSLTHLDLSKNNISGSIPSTIGNLTGLEYLDLSSNSLTGHMPSSLGLLSNVSYLGLNNNHLSGSLPLSLGQLSMLTCLDVSGNHLDGSIPSTLMLPSSLWYLALSDNNMNGKITEVFFQKSLNLQGLDLSRSGLSINISSTWIPSFQLRTLRLKNCQLGGPIPRWISTQVSFSVLDLSANQLVGSIPSWLWDIHMDSLILSNNHLQGSFTPSSAPLRYLDLSMNKLSGRLQPDIDKHLSKAEVLLLADNKFEGQIPTSIVNLTKLAILDMSNNSLTGNVPTTLGDLTYLAGLHLGNNYLEGEIPKELGSLSCLQSLRIGKNFLHGVLPSSLRNLSNLEVLDVGENNLTGNIPHWISDLSSLHVLVMRFNNFRGILSPDIGRMAKLQVLDLSSNFFSGMIPHSYLRFPAMQNSSANGGYLWISAPGSYSERIDLVVNGLEMHYERILSSFTCFDLSNNKLSGSLPPEIENLKGLMYLNLSMNSLSGPIPETLGNLVLLESLDLSLNKFGGQIPWEIGNLRYLAHLNLSYNNLYGKIPQQGGQMLTFDESSYIGNPNLWRFPLEKNCSLPAARACPPVGVEGKREESFEFPWYWMCFVLSIGVGFAAMVLVLKLCSREKCSSSSIRV